MDRFIKYDTSYTSLKEYEHYCSLPENVIDSLIRVWMGWMKEHSKATDSSLPIKERVLAIRNCEDLMRFKHIHMQNCDRYFECLEKKN